MFPRLSKAAIALSLGLVLTGISVSTSFAVSTSASDEPSASPTAGAISASWSLRARQAAELAKQASEAARKTAAIANQKAMQAAWAAANGFYDANYQKAKAEADQAALDAAKAGALAIEKAEAAEKAKHQEVSQKYVHPDSLTVPPMMVGPLKFGTNFRPMNHPGNTDPANTAQTTPSKNLTIRASSIDLSRQTPAQDFFTKSSWVLLSLLAIAVVLLITAGTSSLRQRKIKTRG
jgi:hypothetical protein